MIQGHAYSQSGSMVEIRGGEFIPLYGTKTEVPVGDFLMDVYPVTNAEFLEFVEQNPRWRKSQVKQLFADENYLRSWKNDLSLGSDNLPNSPVTNVSWFAAKNYCECQGKRLPTVDEWEYVAMANETSPDARSEKSYNQYILSWYETPNTFKNTVGNTFKNYWGVYDLHGLVWEWTSDFNSVMIGGESRQDSTGDNNLFCGAAAVGATDLMNYAAFMRYAFRGSVKARYAVKNLGFRCVRDIEKTNL
jgi:formylglycine-generating enzyme required for sulfatase activity